MGIIKSNNNPKNQAIVISAHFDHVGSYKNSLYAGALDNASGVSTVLEITRYLSENLKKEEMKKDIIIAFFNLEEEILRLGGSSKLAKDIESNYDSVVDINIDCIGMKDSKTVVGYNYSTLINDNIVKEIEAMLVESSIDTTTGEYSTSDHINFENGICLYSENQNDVIHTVNDTVDNLSLETIEQVSHSLGDYIINLCKRDELTKIDSDDQTTTYSEIIKKERLDIGTCKVVEKNGKKYHLSEQIFWFNLLEAEEQFNYPFREKLEDLLSDEDSFIFFHIPNTLYLYEKQSDEKYTGKDLKCNIADLYVDEHELNKLYKRKITLDDVAEISVEGLQVNTFVDKNLYFYNDQYTIEERKIIDNAEIVFNYKNNDIYFYYDEQQESKYLSTFIEKGENKYICSIQCKGLNLITEEDIIKVIEEKNAIALWEAIIEIFEQ